MQSEEAVYFMLEGVTGLNIETGMGHVLNSAESYIKILRVGTGNIEEQIASIKAGYKTEAVAGLRINFHSLKGIFSNIGADKLAESSERLELAAKNEEADYIRENVQAYIEEVESFHQKLKEALDLHDGGLEAASVLEGEDSSMPPEKYAEKVNLAKEAVRQFDFAEITEILEELEKVSQGRKKEILEEALDEISEFQYDAVMELLDQLL